MVVSNRKVTIRKNLESDKIILDLNLKVLSKSEWLEEFVEFEYLDIDRYLLSVGSEIEVRISHSMNALCKVLAYEVDTGYFTIEVTKLTKAEVISPFSEVLSEKIPAAVILNGKQIYRNDLCTWEFSAVEIDFVGIHGEYFEFCEIQKRPELQFRLEQKQVHQYTIVKYHPWVKPNINYDTLRNIHSRAKEQGFNLVSVDIMNLKTINTKRGYSAGTACIKDLISRLQVEFETKFVFFDGKHIFLVSTKNSDTIKKYMDAISSDVASLDLEYIISFGTVRVEENSDFDEDIRMLLWRMSVSRSSIIQVYSSFTLDSLKQLLHEVTPETDSHCRRLSVLSVLLGEKMGCTSEELSSLNLGAYLHDIGKVAIRSEVLNKPGRLTIEEWEEMKLHTNKGYNILSKFKGLKDVADIVRHHHERYDGKGYPDGIDHTEISKLVKIVTVVDSFDAILSVRCYKDKQPLGFALEELKKCSGTQFCPETVEKLLELVSENKIDFLGDY